jgi:hypothetical protein
LHFIHLSCVTRMHFPNGVCFISITCTYRQYKAIDELDELVVVVLLSKSSQFPMTITRSAVPSPVK